MNANAPAPADPVWVLAFLAFVVFWLIGWIAASIIYRRRRRKPIWPRVPRGALFTERWASGNNRRNALTKLGGAHNCLLVTVTPERISVSPRFPFNLGFLPELYGLDWDFPRYSIRAIRRRKGLTGEILTVDSLADGGQSIDLRLRDPVGFLKAMAPVNVWDDR